MSVETKHREYSSALSLWKKCRDVAQGEEAVKAAGTLYLPKLSGAKPLEYQGYKDRAMWFDGTARTIQGFTGMAMTTEPEPKLIDAVIPHKGDVTLAGEPFHSIAANAIDEVLTVGRYGILLDYSDRRKRPYWVPFAAEDICNWDVTVRAGDATLTFLVLREVEERRDRFTVTQLNRYRVFELIEVGAALQCQVTTWERAENEKEYTSRTQTILERRGVALDFIPFVCFGPKDLTMRVSKPPLLGLVNVNLSHYRTSADLEHGRHYTALPTPVVSGSKQQTLKIGSAEAWVLPEPGAKAEFLEFTGQGLTALRDAMKDKEQLMQILGARLLEPQKTTQEAHATVRMRHAGDVSVLQTIVSTVNLGLTTLWQWHAWWDGATNNVNDPAIDAGLPQNLTPQPDVDLDNLLLARQADQISYLTYYAAMQRAGHTRPGITAEQEREQILAEGGIDPLNKKPTIPDDGTGAAA